MALTNKDIEKLSGIFVTKEEFKEGVQSLRSELKNEIHNSHDEIMKKLDDMSTEKLMLLNRSRQHEETIENHEGRIKKLEEKVLVA